MNLLTKFPNFDFKTKGRYKWIDFLRGIAIILVVYRHVLNGLENSGINIPRYLETANLIFYSFRMPLFFILSGVFFRMLITKQNYPVYIRNKFNTLLYPYFIWAFIQISIQILLSPYTNSKRNLTDFLFILYQPRELDQFWYLPALFNVSVLYAFTDKLLKKNNKLNFLIGLVFYAIAPFFNEISIISDWMEYYLFFSLGDILSKFFLSGKVDNYSKAKWLLPYSILFIFSQKYYIDNSVTRIEFLSISLIGCSFMILISLFLQRYFSLEWLRVVGFHSLQIYVMHVIFAGFSRVIFVKLFKIHEPHILLFLGILSGTFLPIIIYNWPTFQRFFWYLFTPKRQFGPVSAVVKNSQQ